MPVCEKCGMVGGYHRDECSARRSHVNRIHYPSPNRLGLVTPPNGEQR